MKFFNGTEVRLTAIFIATLSLLVMIVSQSFDSINAETFIAMSPISTLVTFMSWVMFELSDRSDT